MAAVAPFEPVAPLSVEMAAVAALACSPAPLASPSRYNPDDDGNGGGGGGFGAALASPSKQPQHHHPFSTDAADEVNVAEIELQDMQPQQPLNL